VARVRTRVVGGSPEVVVTPGEKRDALLREVDERYAAAIAAGMPYAGKTLQVDLESQSNIDAMVTRITAGVPLPTDFAWRMADNTFLPLDAAGLVHMATGASDFVLALRITKWAHVDAIAALPDAALDSYDTSTGW
jgi:Domain of unknown function (DUF4376)